MITLYDLGMAVEQIRSAANIVEVSGAKNIEAVYTILKLCNDIIIELNHITESNISKQSTDQVGGENGQVDC